MKCMRFLPLVLLLAAIGCTSVDQTEHCVLTRFGKVIDDNMDVGLTWTPIADAECFPTTNQNLPEEEGGKFTVTVQTRDQLTMEVDGAVTWRYKAPIPEVFQKKRTHKAAKVEVYNAIRSGYRAAFASVPMADVFSEKREGLDATVRSSIQDEIGDLAEIVEVFIRGITVPEEIEKSRIQAVQKQQELERARKQFEIDSVNATAKIITAEAEARQQELLAQAYNKNPQLLEVERAKAIAGVCKGVTTCILGGSTTDLLLKRAAQ